MEETPRGGDTSHLERDRHCLIQLHWANVISKHLEKVQGEGDVHIYEFKPGVGVG